MRTTVGARHLIDVSAYSAVAVCDCGFRFLAGDRPAVARDLAAHIRAAHPDRAGDADRVLRATRPSAQLRAAR